VTDVATSESGDIVPRISHLCLTLVKVSNALRDVLYALADLGFVSSRLPPRVNERDGLEVVRLKDRARTLCKERDALHEAMGSLGARLLDSEQVELIIEGGPVEGSFLSWQPGEPEIAWWRRSDDPGSERLPLDGVRPSGDQVQLH